MLLHRIDPAKNMARFYLVEAAPSLLDPFAVLRVWGRIGGAQQHKITPCASAAEAERLAERLVKRKIKRGYKVAGVQNEQEKEETHPQESAQAGHPAPRPTRRNLPGVRQPDQCPPDRELPQSDPRCPGQLQIELL
ncbi:MAG: WGR domain-containing protein [Anaerolineales bacterium]|nr:WGR domain-containing protein [Anaerolineales bacterium]